MEEFYYIDDKGDIVKEYIKSEDEEKDKNETNLIDVNLLRDKAYNFTVVKESNLIIVKAHSIYHKNIACYITVSLSDIPFVITSRIYSLFRGTSVFMHTLCYLSYLLIE